MCEYPGPKLLELLLVWVTPQRYQCQLHVYWVIFFKEIAFFEPALHHRKKKNLKDVQCFRIPLQSNMAIVPAINIHFWLVVWNIFIFPYIGNNDPNWLIFFRVSKTAWGYALGVVPKNWRPSSIQWQVQPRCAYLCLILVSKMELKVPFEWGKQWSTMTF